MSRLWARAAILVALCIGGCATPPSFSHAVHNPAYTYIVVKGDWNDVGAAVAVGIGALYLSITDARQIDENEVEYDFVDVIDQPGFFTARRNPGPESTAPEYIELGASIGRFGDEKREREFLEAVARRLGDLAGVDVAPIRD
ncbi:MAG: hypothetical protein AABZ53_09035 [Planctomycetota bacterium]